MLDLRPQVFSHVGPVNQTEQRIPGRTSPLADQAFSFGWRYGKMSHCLGRAHQLYHPSIHPNVENIKMTYTSEFSDRFWAKVDRKGPDDCWIHQNAPLRDGYSKQFGKLAHRLAYELAKGEIPAGLLVRHGCDNPRCVNPRHLSLGTQLDNMRDMHARGRAGSSKRKLKIWNARDIREIHDAYGVSCTKIAKIYGLTSGHVRNICRGARWAKVA
jgi:hypothetical protein